MTRALLAATAATLLGGCFDNVETTFPAGLEPWEDPNEAPPPEGTAEDPYPEEIVFLRRRFQRASAVHARAYVHADVETTFEAVRHPLSGADRHSEVTFTYETGVDPAYEYSHRSHLVVPDVITVEFELEWRSGVVDRSEVDDHPILTATRWQKVWGTSAITTLEGSIVCTEIAPGVTELQIQYHLDAVSQGHETIETYLTGYFVSILAYAHGEVEDPDDPASWPVQD